MTCEDVKALLVGYLYDDMEEDEEEELSRHLSECNACADELAGLRQTARVLRVWQDVDPQLRLQFVEEHQPRFGWWPRRIPLPRWGAVSLALGAAALLLMALLNLELSYGDGRLDLRVSLLPRPASPPASSVKDTTQAPTYVTTEMLARFQEENFRLMQQLIETSEARQIEFLNSSLSQFAAEVEAQRRRDLRLMDRGLEAVQVTTERQFQETHQILGSLIRLARSSYEEPQNR